jgi:Arc/MetJ-type ribon-helix-helix transcriptional regulator
VNHDTIPELLSKAVAEISEKVAICAQFVEIVEEKRLQERLADIYALLFRFYRDAMTWFLKSRASRFMSSFNEELKDVYQQAVSDMEGRIEVLYRQADSVKFQILKNMSRNIEDMNEERFRQRQIYKSDSEVGRKGLQLITETMLDVQKMIRVIMGDGRSPRDIEQEAISYPGKGKQITGQHFRTYTGAVRSVIIGEEGFKFLNQGNLWLVDGVTLAKLEKWMIEKPLARILWISSPMSNAVSGSRAAALSVLASSLQAEQPIISHFCRRPHQNEVSKQSTSEEAGLLGLVYSLINQLQQFVRDEDWIEVDEESLQKLDGSRESWSASLQVLAALLRTTPNFPCCVIDGINELEWSGGVEWCRELWKIIQQEEQNQGYSLLVTTTGQSRFLAGVVSPRDRYFMSSIPQQVRFSQPRHNA